jgi:hypothetical protein
MGIAVQLAKQSVAVFFGDAYSGRSHRACGFGGYVGQRAAVKASTDEKGQFTVRIRTLLVPPLVQPRLPLLPDGVCTSTLKVPGAETMEEGIETVS